MSNDKTGGPAFPKAGLDVWNDAVSVQTGMTLRDYFAAKALQGLLSCQSEETGFYQAKNAAQEAYAMADAMLEARKS
mgnify:CR=1 FL=1